MKNTFLIIAIIFSVFTLAQKKINIVEYNYTTKQSEDFFNEFLVFGNDNFVYFGYGMGGELTTFEQMANSFDKKNISYYVEKSDNIFYYMGYKTPKIKKITIDNFPPIKWQIEKESKNILNFQCTKATGNFRGRNYTVWFTSEISAPYGPWKLGGLPGLILEAEDDGKMFKYTARRIVLNSDQSLPLKLHEYIKEKKQVVTPLREYVELENTFMRDLRGQVLADFPIGSTVVKKTSLRQDEKEVLFEWEKEPTKF